MPKYITECELSWEKRRVKSIDNKGKYARIKRKEFNRIRLRDACLDCSNETFVIVKKCFINCRKKRVDKNNIRECDPLRCASGCRFNIQCDPIYSIIKRHR